MAKKNTKKKTDAKKKKLLQEKEKEQKKKKIAKAYVSVVKSKRKFPTRQDMAELGITRDMIRHHFVNMSRLRDMAKMMYPKAFSGVIDVEDYLDSKVVKSTKRQRYFITTAVNGQFIAKSFFKSVEYYCKVNKAKLIILPSHDPAHNLDNDVEWHFANEITSKNYPIIFNELALNSNLHISGVRVNAKQINPMTGLSRITQGDGSFIFASPKQALDFVPNSNVKLSHAMMSTGACTLPNYKTTLGNSLRTAFLAEYDHVIGGIVVEIEDDKIYHFRQVQADARGRFIDLGIEYSGSSKKRIKNGITFVMGDYHAGEHDDTAINAWEEIIDMLEIEEVVFHDIFNGMSINHHEDHNIISKARRASKNNLSLKNEIIVTSEEMDRILAHKSIKKGIVAKSNHDEFLIRWLQEGKFKNDPINFQLGCKLADVTVDGIDPLQYGIKALAPLKNEKKLVWLERDEDYKVDGIQLGAHGDKGPNGSRGTKNNLERAYGKCVIGHSHSPGILRGVYQVGTSSKLRLGYNVGPSSWVHCSCIVYSNGQRQLINSINGKWRMK